MKKLILLVLALIVLSGCSSSHDVIIHDYIKDYTIGEVRTAYIGQSVAKVKDFYLKYDSNSSFVTASDDFSIKGNFIKKLFFNYDINIVVKKGISYQTNKVETVNGVTYRVVDVFDIKGDKYGLLIDDKGTILSNRILNDDHDHFMISQDAVIKPQKISFDKTDKYPTSQDDKYNTDNDDKIKMFLGDMNYELLYGGINNVTLTMTYREFTVEDLARPSFFQNVVYETSVKQLRFKETLIDIIEATNEKLVYKVIEDGLKSSNNIAENERKYEKLSDKIDSIKK